MTVAEITPEQKESILNLEEDHFHDLKSKDIKPSKRTQSVSAFANTSGGEIYLGIEEIDKTHKIRRMRLTVSLLYALIGSTFLLTNPAHIHHSFR